MPPEKEPVKRWLWLLEVISLPMLLQIFATKPPGFCCVLLSEISAVNYRMCVFLLPVDICQRNTLQRHLQVNYGWSEGTRGLLKCGGHCLLHCTGARQHLSGDSIQVDEVRGCEKDKHCDSLKRDRGCTYAWHKALRVVKKKVLD